MGASTKLSDWLKRKNGVGVNFGKTSYVAQIMGEHEKYGLERKFISKKIDSSYSGKTGRKAIELEDLQEGAVYEVRGDSWGNKRRNLVVLEEIRETDEGVELETRSLDSDQEAIDYLNSKDEDEEKMAEMRKKIRQEIKSADEEKLEDILEVMENE